MTAFSIALLQIAAAGPDIEANARIGAAACRRAKEIGADLALFPEMFSNGYSYAGRMLQSPNAWRAPGRWETGEPQVDERHGPAIELFRQQATPVDGPFVGRFQALARELDMAIAITFLEATPNGPRNSVSLINRHGEVLFTYAKVHTCAFDLPEAALVAGEAFRVATLDFARGHVNLGAMICYDREYPESARVLAMQGAEIILTPNACGLDRWRLEQFSTRAIENMVGVAMANYPIPQNNGQSCAFHPILFSPGDEEARDNLVVRMGEGESIELATFDIDALRDYRRRETLGGAFRRPSAYGPLVGTEVCEPFLRVGPTGDPWREGRVLGERPG